MQEHSAANQKFISAFLLVGKLEGYSYLLLLGIAMPLKYIFKMPEYVRIAGTMHGLLFVGFIVLLLLMIFEVKMSLKKVGIAFFLSLVPFGTFYLKNLALPSK